VATPSSPRTDRTEVRRDDKEENKDMVDPDQVND